VQRAQQLRPGGGAACVLFVAHVLRREHVELVARGEVAAAPESLQRRQVVRRDADQRLRGGTRPAARSRRWPLRSKYSTRYECTPTSRRAVRTSSGTVPRSLAYVRCKPCRTLSSARIDSSSSNG
jgi:hypothetical protein